MRLVCNCAIVVNDTMQTVTDARNTRLANVRPTAASPTALVAPLCEEANVVGGEGTEQIVMSDPSAASRRTQPRAVDYQHMTMRKSSRLRLSGARSLGGRR